MGSLFVLISNKCQRLWGWATGEKVAFGKMRRRGAWRENCAAAVKPQNDGNIITRNAASLYHKLMQNNNI